jgi:hypothetical protein
MTEKTPKQAREDELIKALMTGLHELTKQESVDWHSFCHQAIHQVVMPQVEPLLNALDEVATAAERITSSHECFVEEYAHPGAEAMGAQWEMRRLLKKLRYFEPHDWTYISRFSATPHEIHKILKTGLCEDTYLNYQRFICEPAVHEAAEDLRRENDKVYSREDLLFSPEKQAMHHVVQKGADYIDPERGGGRWPASLINPS